MDIKSYLKNTIVKNPIKTIVSLVGVFGVAAFGSDYYNLKTQENDKNNKIENATAFVETITDPESWDNISRQPETSFDEAMGFYRNERARNAGISNKIHIISDGERTSVLIVGKERNFIRYESAVIPVNNSVVSKSIHAELGYNAPFDNQHETFVRNSNDKLVFNPEERRGVAVVTLKQGYVPENVIASFGISVGDNGTQVLDFGDTRCVSGVRLASMSCNLK
jgi:hypothetical protein